jgi:MFS family permease
MADTRTAMLRLSALVGERSLFENESYRRLWLAKLLSHIPADAMIYTMLILVVDATGKSFASSLFVVAYIAPSALLGTVSGVLVDRVPKGLLLSGTCAARAALCVMLAISSGSLLPIYIVAVLFAVAGQFSSPAESASLPVVVEPDEYTAANSLNNLGQLLAQIAGLMVLPVLFLHTVGAESLAIVCAILFAAAALQFLLIPGLGGEVRAIEMSVDDTRERFAEAWHRLTLDSVAYVSVIIAVLANTTGLVVTTLLPVFGSQVLGISTENIIFVAAPAAFGVWLALRIVRNVSERVSAWWSVGGSFGGLVAGVMLLAFVSPLGAALADANPFGLFDPGPLNEKAARIMVAGVVATELAFSFTFVNIVSRSIVNRRMPKEIQGRVFAGQGVLTNLASIPPILLTGILADALGVAPVFFVVSICCALAAVYFAARSLASPAKVAY